MIDREALIEKSYALEPLSQTVVRLTTLVADPEAPIGEVVDVASRDPALVGNVLRVANSSRYGGRTEVVSVGDAIVRVGPSVVLYLAMRASVKNTMQCEVPAYGFSEDLFWCHCWAASLAVDACRKVFGAGVVPPEAPTAALLHDIGMLTVAQLLDDEDVQMLTASRYLDEQGHANAERQLLGLDHAEVGALIAEHWGLPTCIRTAISYHHEPEIVAEPGPDFVHLANIVAVRALETDVVDGHERDVSPGVAQRLGVTDEILERLCADVTARLAEETSSEDEAAQRLFPNPG